MICATPQLRCRCAISLHKAAKARAKLGAAPGLGCPVPQRFVPSELKRGGRGAGRRKYNRLVGQIGEADRAALSGLMAAADRLASSIRRSDL
jgi:hypothetical protein